MILTMKLIEKAKLKKINVLYIKKGDTLSLGKTKIKCIYPETTTTASDKNDYCTVLSVKNKNFKNTVDRRYFKGN